MLSFNNKLQWMELLNAIGTLPGIMCAQMNEKKLSFLPVNNEDGLVLFTQKNDCTDKNTMHNKCGGRSIHRLLSIEMIW